MSEGIIWELQFFGKAFLWGVLLTLLYSGLRLFRRWIRHSVFWVAVEDILYWQICGVLVFRMMYLENDGAVRGFALVAIILGMVLYLQFEKFLNKIRKKLKNLVKKIIIN